MLEFKYILDEYYQLPKVIDDNEPKFSLVDKTYCFNNKTQGLILSTLKSVIAPIGLTDEKFFIAGGSLLTLITTLNLFKVKDFDIFPKSKEDFLKIKEKLDKFGDPIQENENCCTYYVRGFYIELIKKFFPTIEECLKRFDFNIVKLGVTEEFNKIHYLDKNIFTSIFRKIIIVKCPITFQNSFSVLRRIIKYSKKGYSISDYTIKLLHSTISLKLSGEYSEEEKNKLQDTIKELSKHDGKGIYNRLTQGVDEILGMGDF